MNAKTIKESKVESVELIQPSDLNVNNTLFGGRLVSFVDEVAAICAYRHTQMNVATASIDQLDFRRPVPVKSILTLRASVNRVFNTSMEIGVKVTMRLHTEPGDHDVCSAYLTFVGVNEQGEPTEIPQGTPESEDEKRRYHNALKRRELRFKLKDELNQ
jgi:acyl-CoA hydrolase